MIRFVHTADWHLGRTFHRTTSTADCQERLRSARFRALDELGRRSREAEAQAMLVAGDLFHGDTVDDRILLAGLDAIGHMGLPVVAIPGNHDHGGAGGLWDREIVRREMPRRAPNLTLVRGEARVLEVSGMAILALPVRERLLSPQLRELTGLGTATGLPRVGLVHAPVGAFDEDACGRTLDTAGAADLTLDYLALGDFHRQQRLEDAALPACAAWYAGTPEPDNYPSHGQEGERQGGALLVDLPGPGLPPVVAPLPLEGGYTWVRLHETLQGEADLDRLQARLGGYSARRVQSTLCRLDLEGSVLGLAGMQRLDALLRTQDASFEVLERSGTVHCRPDPEELASLTRHPGIVGSVATRLAGEAAGHGSEAAIAQAALEHLHLRLAARNA